MAIKTHTSASGERRPCSAFEKSCPLQSDEEHLYVENAKDGARYDEIKLAQEFGFITSKDAKDLARITENSDRLRKEEDARQNPTTYEPAPIRRQNFEQLQGTTHNLLQATQLLDSQGFDIQERHSPAIATAILNDDEQMLQENVLELQEDLRNSEVNFFRAEDEKQYYDFVNNVTPHNTDNDAVKIGALSTKAEFQNVKDETKRLMEATELLDSQGARIRSNNSGSMVYALVQHDPRHLRMSNQHLQGDLEGTATRFDDPKTEQKFNHLVYGVTQHENNTHSVEGTAAGLRIGDTIRGEKLQENGRWADDNSSKIRHIEQQVSMSGHNATVQVEFENGQTREFSKKAPLTVLRDGEFQKPSMSRREATSTLEDSFQRVTGGTSYAMDVADSSYSVDDAKRAAQAVSSGNATHAHVNKTVKTADTLKRAGRTEESQILYDAVNNYRDIYGR